MQVIRKTVSNNLNWTSNELSNLEVGDEITDILKNGEEITFVVVDKGVMALKNCLSAPHRIDLGIDIAGHGIYFTEMRNYLNEYIFSLLPDGLKNIIKPRTFNYDGTDVNDRLWLFSEFEIFGENTWGTPENEEKQFEYFKIPSHRVKTLNNSNEAVFWWERSVFDKFSDYFCCVYSGGGTGYYHANNALGLCFGFLF